MIWTENKENKAKRNNDMSRLRLHDYFTRDFRRSLKPRNCFKLLITNGAQGRIKFVWNKFSMSVFYE